MAFLTSPVLVTYAINTEVRVIFFTVNAAIVDELKGIIHETSFATFIINKMEDFIKFIETIINKSNNLMQLRIICVPILNLVSQAEGQLRLIVKAQSMFYIIAG